MPSVSATRPALALPYLQRKRRLLATELGDCTEGVFNYGKHDPLDVPAARCDTCGGEGRLEKVQAEPSRWMVICVGCGKQQCNAQKRPWLARLDWNQINLGTQDYRRLPLFGLADMTKSAAHALMVATRLELERRLKLAGLDRRINGELDRRPPGHQYRMRLEAYLAWSMLALRLIKVAGGNS